MSKPFSVILCGPSSCPTLCQSRKMKAPWDLIWLCTMLSLHRSLETLQVPKTPLLAPAPLQVPSQGPNQGSSSPVWPLRIGLFPLFQHKLTFNLAYFCTTMYRMLRQVL
jgi:hypothetical protein